MYRGTTPTIEITLDFDLTGASEIYVTFEQGGQDVLEKTKDEMSVETDMLGILLSQEETLSLASGALVYVQIRALMSDGMALASNIMSVEVQQILKEGMI